MGTPWDRAAEGYLAEWVPRFVPYHLDLVRELALSHGQHVLATSVGPGSEVIALARAVGAKGRIRATDASEEMVRIATEQVTTAALETRIVCERADAAETRGGPWDAVACSFGLWQLADCVAVVRAWGASLTPRGKVGVLTWGPPDVDDPFEQLSAVLRELEPSVTQRAHRVNAERAAMARLFEDAGLAMVRHTIVRHTLAFTSAEAFVRALREACTWRSIWEELGAVRMERVAAKFYESVGGPEAAVSFAPAATIAIAAKPGAEVELAHRPSVRVPTV